jgi:hypothetical protein
MSYSNHLHDNYNTTEWLQSKINELHEKFIKEYSKILQMPVIDKQNGEVYFITERYLHFWEEQKAYVCFELYYNNNECVQKQYQQQWAQNVLDAWKMYSSEVIVGNDCQYPEKESLQKRLNWSKIDYSEWFSKESHYDREYDKIMNIYKSLMSDEPKDYTKENLHTFKQSSCILSVFDLICKKDFVWIQSILHPTNKEDYIAYESIEYDYIQWLFIQCAVKTYSQDELIQLWEIIGMDVVWDELYLFLDLKNQDNTFSLFKQYIISQKEQKKDIFGITQQYLYFLWKQDEHSPQVIDEAYSLLDWKDLAITLYNYSILQDKNTEEYLESILLYITDPYEKCDFLLNRWLYPQCKKHVNQVVDIHEKIIILIQIAYHEDNFDTVYSVVSEIQDNKKFQSIIVSQLVELFAHKWMWKDLEQWSLLLTNSWDTEEQLLWKFRWYKGLLREFLEKKYSLENLGIEPELYNTYYWMRDARKDLYDVLTAYRINKSCEIN